MFSKHMLIKLINYLIILSHHEASNWFKKKYEKYLIVKICPNKINGGSTGRAPIHVNKIIFIINNQNKILFSG